MTSAALYQLLPFCTQREPSEGQNVALQQVCQSLAWDSVPSQAENQGLAPLLYRRLYAANIAVPAATNRTLKALYLRHRHANQVRTEALTVILSAFTEAGIQPFLLKGIALAHLLYPEPGLRPMRDIDLLVKRSEARPAQQILADLGFEAELPKNDRLPDKHLAAAARQTSGLSLSIEIHHDLFSDDFPDSMRVETLTVPPLEIDLAGMPAYTLGYEDMLWHLCRHAVFIFQPLRLIWVADIVGFAEKFVAEIEWGHVARNYPLILPLLAHLHHLLPLSPSLQQQAGLNIGAPPRGVGQEFRGWPRYSLTQQQTKSTWQILRDSFYPSAWWLSLNYGLSTPASKVWYRWVGHPFSIVAWAMRLIFSRYIRPKLVRKNEPI